MKNINENSTKSELVEGAMEYIDYVERNTFTHKQAFTIAAIALVVGFIAG